MKKISEAGARKIVNKIVQLCLNFKAAVFNVAFPNQCHNISINAVTSAGNEHQFLKF